MDGRLNRGGKGVRICREESRDGSPVRSTNRFRVCRRWRLRDSVALAMATTVDWGWMESRDGVRRTRDQWLSMAS